MYDGTGSKTPSVATRVKSPKRIKAGKKLAEYNKKKKASLKKVDVSPAANPSSVNQTVKESQREGVSYKGLRLVANGIFTYIIYKKLASTPRPIEKKNVEIDPFKMDFKKII